MSATGRGVVERAVVLAGAVAAAGLAWLTARVLDDAGALPWVLGVVAALVAAFAALAPLRWVRMALGMQLFTQDMFREEHDRRR